MEITSKLLCVFWLIVEVLFDSCKIKKNFSYRAKLSVNISSSPSRGINVQKNKVKKSPVYVRSSRLKTFSTQPLLFKCSVCNWSHDNIRDIAS